MKRLLYILAIAGIGWFRAVALAEDKPLTVAVFDFTDNAKRVLGRNVTALITANLSGEPRLTLVERAQLKKALGEQALGLSGNVNFEAAAKVGQMTGAKVLISGRAIRTSGKVVVVANLIGTETSRVMSQSVQGSSGDLFTLTSNLCDKIVQTLTTQTSNFVAHAGQPQEKRIDAVIAKIKGEYKRTISVAVSEKIPGERGRHQTAQNELGAVLQKAGFSVVDDRSERRPDIMITGSAIAAGGEKNGNLYSCRATLEIKAQERVSGKIISIDRQQSNAVDISKQTSARQALEAAADGLAERLLPTLAESDEDKP